MPILDYELAMLLSQVLGVPQLLNLQPDGIPQLDALSDVLRTRRPRIF